MEKMPFVAVETVNALAAGEYVSLVAGQVYELTAAVAADLSRVGYIRSLPPAAAGPETASMQPGAEKAVLPKARRRRA